MNWCKVLIPCKTRNNYTGVFFHHQRQCGNPALKDSDFCETHLGVERMASEGLISENSVEIERAKRCT